LEEDLKEYFRKNNLLYIVSIIIVVLDQLTKELVRTNLAMGSSWFPIQGSTFIRIIHWSNTGVAFGMFQGKNVFFAFLAALVAGAIIYYYPFIPEQDKVLRFALAMQLGGAVGNLIDRILIGQVTDFVSVGNFAVFNVADSCITVGVGVLLLGVYLEDQREKKRLRLEKIMPPPAEAEEEIKTWPNI
jgi:signal peptidase II